MQDLELERLPQAQQQARALQHTVDVAEAAQAAVEAKLRQVATEAATAAGVCMCVRVCKHTLCCAETWDV